MQPRTRSFILHLLQGWRRHPRTIPALLCGSGGLHCLFVYRGQDPQAFKTLNIAVASDIHLGTPTRRGKSRLQRIVHAINGLDPDLVLLPGDIVNEDLGPVIRQNLGKTLRSIKSRFGVVAITGNHEYIYVSCGVGTWGPPVRIGNRPEIVQIKLSFS